MPRKFRGSRAAVRPPVAEVAEAGEDVALLVQAAIELGEMDGDVGMALVKESHSLGRADDADEDDLLRPAFLEEPNRVLGRAAGREHRVEDEADALPEIILGDTIGHGARVRARPERLVVAAHAKMPYLRPRKQFQKRLLESQPGPKDWNEGRRSDEEMAGRDL